MSPIRKFIFTASLALAGALSTAPASAVIPYPTPGFDNPVLYSFSATATGFVSATLALPTGAAFDNILGYRINAGPDVLTTLHNHDAVGTMVSFAVTAGDVLRFYIASPVGTWYSDKALNSDGFNHVYSVVYGDGSLGPLVPLGRYLSFEDLIGGGDKNYHDFNIVVTNVTSGVPEPATWAMMLLGFAGLAWAFRRRMSPVAA